MTESETEFCWQSETDTERVAQAWARSTALGNCTLAFHGPLGVGKTTLTRHVLRALGVQGRIKSPTYALVESYDLAPDCGVPEAWHFDFYRLDDPTEWEEAGLRDTFSAPGLKIVEWLEKAGDQAPAVDLHVTLAFGPDETSRQVNMRAVTPTGVRLIEALAR